MSEHASGSDVAWRDALASWVWAQAKPCPGFEDVAWRVYRNTSQRACIESLKANLASLRSLLGDEAFGILARAFLNAHPPTHASLFEYGLEMPEFICQFEPAAPWPYLSDLARLDVMWMASHVAPDAMALTASELLGLQQRSSLPLCRPHPAARWLFNPEHPVATLWMQARALQPPSEEVPWVGQGLLLTRPGQHVIAAPIGLAACVFLNSCEQGKGLEAALIDAHLSEPAADLAALVALMLDQGALTLTSL
jgi:Putative DNA-binding domain